ncbi:MAG: glycoside hydrolase family 13 protein [Clostridiales Family XIII bacterium]|jgi:glycosidase|nr:glycoside hydrolase family 13 protein [Clostridiales Family XIII bacterium]
MDRIFFGGVEIEDANIIHDSTKELFRCPLGAAPCGTEIALALKINNLHIERAMLCVLNEGKTVRLELFPEGDMLRARYCAPGGNADEGGCVLWYWFEVTLQGGAICCYGAEPGYTSGLGRIYPNPPPAFQITVYDKNFTTPDWAKSAVLYQIFPDRFARGDEAGVRAGVACHKGKGRADIELRENWGALPVYEAKEGCKYYMPSDIFGGDLEGIRRRLPYLKELGVTLVYLNPIFEAASNHRYNTGDYLKIDPILGDTAAFRRLAAEAAGLGIRIMLDGVFSHTGDDSVYFNKYGRYDGLGAYQSKDSPYFGWYKFSDYPGKYKSWWGFESLPEIDEHNAGWQGFTITGENSVVKKWLGEGAAGYRLDVADELPDGTIEQIRKAVKETDPEAFLIGEVWEDATTKQDCGKGRTYALGRGLDAVMNYPFRDRTAELLLGKIDARLYCRFLVHQQHSYPPQMYYTLMNLLSSHDVSRIRSALAKDFDPRGMTRAEQARFELTADEFALGGLRQRLAAAIQFSLPGIPSVYYGDEVGMTGLLDPFNRGTWREEDAGICEWYKTLAALRSAHPVMSTGNVRFFSTNGNVLGIFRYTVNGRDFFGRELGADAVLAVVNPTGEPHRIVFDFGELYAALPLDEASAAVWRGTRAARSLLSDRIAPLESGLVVIDVPPAGAELFQIE